MQRQLITLEFLTEGKFTGDEDMAELYERAMCDDLSMSEVSREVEDIDGARLAELAIAQGSDPEFFGIDETGKPLNT